jgi:hypothetical protein
MQVARLDHANLMHAAVDSSPQQPSSDTRMLGTALGVHVITAAISGPADVGDGDKQRLAGQLVQLDEAYPGGLLQYVRNARRLLQDSREGANPTPIR